MNKNVPMNKIGSYGIFSKITLFGKTKNNVTMEDTNQIIPLSFTIHADGHR